MKAIVYYNYGSADVLKLEEADMPTPKDGEVLVKVHAVSIHGSDREGLRGKPLYARMRGLRKPGTRYSDRTSPAVSTRPARISRYFSQGMKYLGKFLDTMAALPSMPALLKRPWHGNQPA